MTLAENVKNHLRENRKRILIGAAIGFTIGAVLYTKKNDVIVITPELRELMRKTGEGVLYAINETEGYLVTKI